MEYRPVSAPCMSLHLVAARNLQSFSTLQLRAARRLHEDQPVTREFAASSPVAPILLHTALAALLLGVGRWPFCCLDGVRRPLDRPLNLSPRSVPNIAVLLSLGLSKGV